MFNEIQANRTKSQAINDKVKEFLANGGKINQVPMGATADFGQICTSITHKKDIVTPSHVKEKRARKANKMMELGKVIYELRQKMSSKEVCKKLDISMSAYNRRILAYKAYCQSNNIDYNLPDFRDRTKTEDVERLRKEIVEKYQDGVSKKELMKQYGFSGGYINQILHRQGINRKECFKQRNQEIIALRRAGWKLTRIGKLFNLSKNRVSAIVNAE